MAVGEDNNYSEDGRLGLLFIEPVCDKSKLPLIDDLTMKMTAAYRAGTKSENSYRGFHTCFCDARSDNKDHYIGEEFVTNSLCIHYLAYHREEIPKKELEKVSRLAYGTAKPTLEELAGPIAKSQEKSQSFNGSFAEFLAKKRYR